MVISISNLVINCIVSAVSILIGYFIDRKSHKKKKLVYDIESFELIDDKFSKVEKLEIKYADQPVANLMVSKIFIWNDGQEPIMKNDVAEKDQLRIIAEQECDILSYELIYPKDDTNANDIRVTRVRSERENTILLNFNFLNKTDTLIMKVFHIGEKDLEVKGTIIGFGQIAHKEIKLDEETIKETSSSFTLLWVVIGISTFIIYTVLSTAYTTYSGLFFCIGFCFIGLLFYITPEKLVRWKNRVPQPIREHYDKWSFLVDNDTN